MIIPDEIRQQHIPVPAGYPYLGTDFQCNCCGEKWPCTCIELLDRVDELDGAIQVMLVDDDIPLLAGCAEYAQ